MRDELQSKLRELSIEDMIWFIYIGIIFMSWYSNSKERLYYKNKDEEAKKTYIKITKGIFTILVIVYSYFLYSSYKSLKSLKNSDSSKKKLLVTLSFISSLLIFISGLIYLYIAYNDDELSVEIAFN